MLIFCLLLFSVTFLRGQIMTAQINDCSCPETDNATLTAFLLDETTIKDLKGEIETLRSSNDLLKIRLDLLATRLDQQNQGTTQNCENCANLQPLIDVRNGLPHDPNPQNCTQRFRYPPSCAEAAASKRFSGIYTIQIDEIDDQPFLVNCDEDTQGGGWTIIQRRMDGSVDFFRDWHDYKIGFGNLASEFFIGLDKLHALTTTNGPQELLIVLSDFDGITKYAKYDSFAIGNEDENYALKLLGAYSGDANDSLTYHVGQKWSTKDKKNDIHSASCASAFKGAWWYKNCHVSNLNGLYLRGKYDKDKYAQGVVWREWHGHYYSLKDVKMMIRPRRI